MSNQPYWKRFAVCIIGLVLYGFGNFMGVIAGSAGTNAWNTLGIGVSDAFGISFGMATFSISLAIIIIDVLGKGRLGIGTVLNIVLVSIFSEFFLTIFSFIPKSTDPILGAIYTLIGQVVISFATIFYMKPALGCGPRDTLMVIIGNKFPKTPIGIVKFFVEILALVAGFLLGAPIGLGTLLIMILQATIFQFACKITRFDPRDLVHDSFSDTFRKLFKKNEAAA